MISLISLFILTSNSTFAQGPNAPEAGAFEPVDATDMVSLLTGDFTYVLPLLTVPSPEGGYPLALSYHAGIAMDQEASWVGLGWSVNPGAINRGVNGYPDDWKNGMLQESFYDVGGSDVSTSVGVSYTSIAGAWSVGVGISHNSNKGFGGYVSAGYGIPGTPLFAGATVGVSPGGQFYGSGSIGYTFPAGGSIGLNIGSQGIGINGGYNWGEGEDGNFNSGFNIGLNMSYEGESSLSISYAEGEKGKKNSIGLSLSSRGLSVSGGVGGVGMGTQISFANSISMNDYNVDTDSDFFALAIPTPIGSFNLGYSKQKVKWYLNSHKTSNVSGALYLGDAIKYECEVKSRFNTYVGQGTVYTSVVYVDSPSDCNCNALSNNPVSNLFTCVSATLISSDPTNGGKYFMDVNEVGITSGARELNKNNAMFPAFDSFNVSAQGLSGSMTPRVSRTGALLGLHRTFANSTTFESNYNLSRYSGFQNGAGGSTDVYFYFNNQYSSSLQINKASFNTNTNSSNIYDYYNSGSGTTWSPRKKDGRFVQYYTLQDMEDGTAENDGLLMPIGFEPANAPDGVPIPENLASFLGNGIKTSIGGFKIVAPDGKTYHYSLPVYNLKTSTRTFGVIQNKPERESYFETNQGAYATHWLLTAITGPDYYNVASNTRNYPDEGDYGYWVRFDYGKWTNNSVWKSPYAEEYDVSEDNPNIKTKTYGKKQLYYLDRIKTRTHTAVFVKNIRFDNVSPEWKRRNFQAPGVQPTSSYFDEVRYTIPKQRPLRLEKIILVKNEDDLVNKAHGSSLANTGTLFPPISGDPIPDYNIQDNVIDVKDNIAGTLAKAVKVIDFGSHYSYSLVTNSPNTSSGRLTLNGISFQGKGGTQLVPPYKFEYLNNRSFNYDMKDLWGYYENNPAVWSMNKITTPTGGSININYESDDYDIAVAETGRVFNKHLKFTFFANQLPPVNGSSGRAQIKVEVDDQDSATENFLLSDYFVANRKVHFDLWYSAARLQGSYPAPFTAWSSIDVLPQEANIISINQADNSMIVEVNASYKAYAPSVSPALEVDPVSVVTSTNGNWQNQKKPRPLVASLNSYSLIHSIISNKTPDGKNGGGLRVKELSITDGTKTYKTRYSYNKPNSNQNQSDSNYVSSGVISYLPFPDNSDQPIAYGSQLPAPTPMYEYVTVNTGFDTNTNSYSNRSVFKFKVLDEKDPNSIKFGELFEISEQTVLNQYNSNQSKNVNIKNYELTNNFACLGQILEIEQFNGKNQLISKTINNYASNGEITQGVIQESFQSYKEVNYKSSDVTDEWLINTSTRTIYPSVLKSTTTIIGGHSSTTNFDKHDNISGQLLETTTVDSHGNRFRTKTTPAYTIPEYSTGLYNMGAVVNGATNKNMLTQTAANFTYLDVNGNWKPISATINTWSNQWKNFYILNNTYSELLPNQKARMWRKHKTYVWNGDINPDGSYQGFNGNYDNFNWEIDGNQTNSKWINTSTITRYDNFSMPLEVKDINDSYVATKMCDHNTKVLAVGNSRLTEMFASGSEYYVTYNAGVNGLYEGSVLTNAQQSTEMFHTGKYSSKTLAGKEGFKVELYGPHNSEKYKISVWANKANYTNAKVNIGGGNISFNGEIVTAGNWVQLNHYFDVPAQGITVYVTSASGTIYFDDFRMHPTNSNLTSYVYNDWDELTHIIGTNNLATRYEYDQTGKLIRTFEEIIDASPSVTGGFKLIKEIDYNYKGVAISDSNGDGIVDPIGDNTPQLYLSLGVANHNVTTTTLTAYTNGGSGDYEYRWAISSSSSNLNYGSWGTSNTRSLTTYCDPLTGRRYYKCQVRDKVTGQTTERSGSHQRGNCNGGGGPIEILDQQR